MPGSPVTRRIHPGEEAEVCRLVERIFSEFVAPDFPPEGIAEFLSFASPAAMAERRAAGQVILVAEQAGRIVGMLELRGFAHISLLFAETPGQGIGRALYGEALRICRERPEATGRMRVHASRYSVPIYRKLGFEAEGPGCTENGITYVPMWRASSAGRACSASVV
jgi:GNAT superfamily N-acetyltransferase